MFFCFFAIDSVKLWECEKIRKKQSSNILQGLDLEVGIFFEDISSH